VKHCIERYGQAEVQQWYWEVWNEPNISYWKGTPQEYYKLYDYAVDGVRRALPTARVGGPEQAGGGGKFLHDFLQHCIDGPNEATGKTGSPIDFISFHAKGNPKVANGHQRMGIDRQLNNIESGFSTVAEFPQFKNTPIVIGESDPDGCAACTGPQLAYRNTPQYASYTAEAFSRTLQIASEHQVNFLGALNWSFEFENEPFFAGHRTLSTNGLDLPILNVFRMLSQLHGTRLAVESSGVLQLKEIEKYGVRSDPDINSLATIDDHQLAIVTWNYHDDDVSAPVADVELTLAHLPPHVSLDEYRIDQTHTNPYSAWIQFDSPSNPSPAQLALLHAATRPERIRYDPAWSVEQGELKTDIFLPRQGVSLLVLTFH
jgi:xylan 1,4-beta-xylosidase